MRKTVLLLALSLGFGASTSFARGNLRTPPIAARLAKDTKAKGPKIPSPTLVDKKVKLSPDGLKFGMTIEEISKLYEKVFDEEFVPLYKSVEPGPRMAELDSELSDKKQLILRNKLDFGSLPSGLDNTPLGGEYTYNNGESMTQVKLRSGIQRYFFFFGNHLWKVLDVHKLGKKSRLGADYDAAVEGLTKQLGKPPRVLKADPEAGRRVDQADWEDKDTILRIEDHGGGAAGVLYVDRKIEEGIDRFRTNKSGSGGGVDHSVSDVLRTSGPASKDTEGTKKK